MLTHPAQWGEVELARLVAAGEQAARVTRCRYPTRWRWPAGTARKFRSAGTSRYSTSGRRCGPRSCAVAAPGSTLAGRPSTDPDLGGDALIGELAGLVAGSAGNWTLALDRLSRGDDEPARLFRARLRTELTALAGSLAGGDTGTLRVPELPAGAAVTRADFEARITPLLHRAADRLRAAADRAGVAPAALAGVYLAGAASAIPLLADLVGERIGVRPRPATEPGTVVALGALTRVWLPGAVAAPPLARTPTSSLRAGRDPAAGPLPADPPVDDGPVDAQARPAGWRPWATPVPGGATVFGYADGTLYVAGSRVCALDLGTGATDWTANPYRHCTS